MRTRQKLALVILTTLAGAACERHRKSAAADSAADRSVRSDANPQHIDVLVAPDTTRPIASSRPAERSTQQARREASGLADALPPAPRPSLSESV